MMATISVKTKDRIAAGLKKYKTIIKKAQSQDINESDTVTIIVDMLQDIFGYDKFNEVTSEVAIKKTFCDLAIKIDDKIKVLIEVKSAGTTLNENHIKQAVDYGSNKGIDWVVLTNGIIWKIYKIIFGKPVSNEMLYEFDITAISAKNESELLQLYMISKEGIAKSSKTPLQDFYAKKEIVNKFIISNIILSEDGLNFIRKNLKKISADSKATNDDIEGIVKSEIIKREVMDDEAMKLAKNKVNRALKKKALNKETK
ncbi:MAG: type I restriction enzyme HsdR N-terminal domain-containing protein [Erysipelotrichaceae bacterium]|nr:type I restriction enzyme HsdR N-terminal domain-containing protein [Lachnospiraceae bacterium]MBE6119968.1 type I restriction enzyme HsdR N-terminal domain-containing protein [Erysipelotrichaceae bacterium]